MRIFEVMTEGVRTVPSSLPASEARDLMRTSRIHHLVVTSGARVVGILSDRDVGGRIRAGVLAGNTVADLMTTDVVTVQRTETVRQAANRMQGRVIGCLPVMNGTRLVGIVTISDLLRLLGRGIDRPERGQRPIATHGVPHRKQRGKAGTW